MKYLNELHTLKVQEFLVCLIQLVFFFTLDESSLVYVDNLHVKSPCFKT